MNTMAEFKELIHPDYLGDGLYVAFDGSQIVLAASDGQFLQHVVYLDSSVLRSFDNYVKRLTVLLEKEGEK